MPELRDSTVTIGVPGLNGTGITAPEKTALTNDTTALKAATYITQTPDATLSAEQALSALATGLVKVTTGTGVLSAATAADLPAHTHAGVPTSASFLIDGGGATITTGVKGDLRIPFAGTITGLTSLADQTGTSIVQVWKDTFANYPPTSADQIASMEIISGIKSEAFGLSIPVAAGDVIRFNVSSVTSHQRVTLILTIARTV